MERVGQLFLDGLCTHGPMRRVFEPVGALCDVGPGADRRDPPAERVDVAFDPVEPGKFIGEPSYWNIAVIFTDMAEDAGNSPRVVIGSDFAEIRQTTGCPQPRDHIRMAGMVADGRIFGKALEDREIDRFGCCPQGGFGRLGFQRGDQRVDSRQIGIALAPIEMFQFGKAMALDRLDFFGAESRRPLLATQTAEGAVLLVPPRASGNLRHFGHGQPPLPPPVEFVQAGKCDVRDVHVEPHADGVGRDEIIDVARLIHRHLRVAGAGRQRSHHHRRPAARPAQHFGDRINFLRAERDDHRPFGEPREFLRASIAECRKARTLDDFSLGDERADHRAQAFRTEDHRLLATAHVEHPVGKDMPALGIRAQLCFIERRKGDVPADRHRFGGAQQPARARRHDLFLAGDQADFLWPLDRDNAVINLTRKQAQRKADHA